jgi:transcriptional pleiotropic regulator of transition state genes
VKTVGLPRKVDHLGRVVIPVEFRRLLGIVEGDEVEITMDGDRLVLVRVEPACVFCGSITDLRHFRDRWVCAGCASEIGAGGD